MQALSWAAELFGEADLGDLRRTDRLVMLASKVVEGAERSLPSMLGNDAENKAAQRFFANEGFSYENIIEPVIENTLDHANSMERVLLVQDTSHLNFDSHIATSGLGHIGSTHDKSFQGIMMHWTLALDHKGACLGVASLKLWEREKTLKKQKLNAHQTKPITEKESYKWLEAVESLDGKLSSKTQAIWIADREADIYEHIAAIIAKNQDFVIRANTNRIVLGDEPLLKECIRTAPVAGCAKLLIDASKEVEVEISFCDVHLLSQRKKGRARHTQACEDHEISLVRVAAKDPAEKLEWILLTTLPIDSLADCLEVIWLYKQRWQIELIHKALKSGFRAQNLCLNNAEKLEKALAIMVPCAAQVYRMAQLQHSSPSLPARAVLSKIECILLAKKFKKQRDYIPSIKEAWFWIGKMGGHRGSKSQAPPGQITFWRGLMELKAMAVGVMIYHQP